MWKQFHMWTGTLKRIPKQDLRSFIVSMYLGMSGLLAMKDWRECFWCGYRKQWKKRERLFVKALWGVLEIRGWLKHAFLRLLYLLARRKDSDVCLIKRCNWERLDISKWLWMLKLEFNDQKLEINSDATYGWCTITVLRFFAWRKFTNHFKKTIARI